MSFYEWVDRLWLVFTLSVCGGIAGSINRKERKVYAFIGGCFAAAFTGIVVFMLLDFFPNLSETVKTGIASVFAYSGGKGLDLLTDRLVAIVDAVVGKIGKK